MRSAFTYGVKERNSGNKACAAPTDFPEPKANTNLNTPSVGHNVAWACELPRECLASRSHFWECALLARALCQKRARKCITRDGLHLVQRKLEHHVCALVLRRRLLNQGKGARRSGPWLTTRCTEPRHKCIPSCRRTRGGCAQTDSTGGPRARTPTPRHRLPPLPCYVGSASLLPQSLSVPFEGLNIVFSKQFGKRIFSDPFRPHVDPHLRPVSCTRTWCKDEKVMNPDRLPAPDRK